MANSKYKFNPETLQYEDGSDSKKKRILRMIFMQIMAAIIVAVVLFVGFSYISETPKERKIKRENKVLETQYNDLIKRKEQLDKYTKELVEKDNKIHQVIFDNDIDSSELSVANPYAKFHNVNILPIAKKNKNRLLAIEKTIKEKKKEYEFLQKLIEKKKDDIANIPAIQPIINTELKYPVYGFGKRIDPVYKSPVLHKGIDFAAPEGTPVFATADGKVILAKNKRGFGNKIEINHGNGYVTYYAHLKEMKVSRGKKVKRGDMIGTVGNTGKSFIPHLHYEIRYEKKSINPVNYFFLDLTPEKFYQIAKDANKVGLSLD